MNKMKGLKKRRASTRHLDTQIAELVALEKTLKGLPPMSDLQKAKMEQGMAIDHLYYSSKIEGTHLTKKRIDKAIYGQGVPQA
jgi:hypothetical protein